MPKLENVTNSMMSNPLVLVVIMLLVVLIILGVIRMIMPSFSAGVGVNAHLGTIRGSVNLEAFENQNGPCLAVFKAEWCGHCKRLMPEIQKLQQENVENVNLVIIDSDQQPQLIKEHGIQGFPSIRFYPNGLGNKSDYEDYNGERTAQSLKTFMQR